MKKTFITLLALAGVAGAVETGASILEQDFTIQTSLPTGWTETNMKSDLEAPLFTWDGDGAVNRYNWTTVSMSTEVDIDSSYLNSTQKYLITFDTFATGNETHNLFYLSSSSYSIVIGNSYNTNAYVSVGTINAEAEGDRITFQDPSNMDSTDAGTVTSVTASKSSYSNGQNGVQTAGGELDVHNPLSYTLTLSAGKLDVSVTDINGQTWSDSITINDSFEFDSLGFVVDGSGGNAGVKNISVTVVPEPTTATLSLLALAGLAARRRRK